MLKKTVSPAVVASPNAAKKSVAKKVVAKKTGAPVATSNKATVRKTPASSSPVKKVVAKKVVTKKVVTKPAAKKTAVKKPVEKSLVKTAVKRNSKVTTKTAVKFAVKSLVPVAGAAKGKIKKSKLVRDSFTMPESEYQILNDVKKTFLKSGVAVKKSELLRAGVALLNTTSEDKLRILIAGLPALKAGRPKKDK